MISPELTAWLCRSINHLNGCILHAISYHIQALPDAWNEENSAADISPSYRTIQSLLYSPFLLRAHCTVYSFWGLHILL